jgi:hypothetical protein
MTNHPEPQIGLPAEATDTWQNEGGSVEPRLVRFAVDESPHSSDGLLLHCLDGAEPVTAFISRRVMDDWADPGRPLKSRKSLYRHEYNSLALRNLPAIQRIVASKYRRGLAFNRQHPFVDVLFSDITESGEVLDAGEPASPLDSAGLKH